MTIRRRPAAGLVAVFLSVVPRPSAAQNPIAAENALPGDATWRLTHTAAGGTLEAYAGEASVEHGDPIEIHVRADGPHSVTWRLYRMGWYGGADARRVAQGGPVAVGSQPVPAPDPSTGRIECRWPATFTIHTAASWTSGVYLLVLERDDGPQTYAIFVVRADERKGAAVVQSSFTTYQAYNAWGGKSLYVGPAQEVSFDRPFAEGSGSGEYFRYEHDFVRWAEARGFDLTYVTNLDLDRDPSLLMGQKLFLSVGHDEYWSHGARATLEAALAAGVNAAFLSGNAMFWQIRLEPSRIDPARPRRTQVCYKKQFARDPLRGTPLETVAFRDPALDAPENAVMGVMYTGWILADAPWVVRDAGSWIYQGTGVHDGDTIPGIVGYEVDRTFANGRGPPALEAVAHSPVAQVGGEPDWHEAALSTRSSGAFVFSTGTIEWSWGLSRGGVADARVQRMTENVFLRAGLSPEGGQEPKAPGPPPPDDTGAAAGVTTLAGAAFQEALVDGPASQARFARPSGVAVTPAGEILVADTGNHAIRLVHADAAHTVETIMGDGTPGAGEGAHARLSFPEAVAPAPDGSVVVADTGNSRLMRLRHAAGGWTAETLAGAVKYVAFVDGPAAQARFAGPAGMVFVGGDLYVADRGNHAIRKITADGQVSTVAGHDDGVWLRDGPAATARFHFPSDLTSTGDALLVLDAGNRLIRRIALAGLTVTTLAGARGGGFADGAAASARFMPEAGIATDGDALLVADSGNARLRRIAGGTVTTFAGTGQVGGRDAPGPDATLAAPSGLAALGNGVWVVADEGASTLRLAGAVEVATPAGTPGTSGSSATPTGGGRGGGGGCGTAQGGAGVFALAVLLAAVRRLRTARVRG